MSILSIENSVVNTLQSFANTLQATLSNRLANIQTNILNAKNSSGQTLFSQTLVNQITSITNQYKAILGNPNAENNIALGQQGNRLLFTPTNLYQNQDYFTNLQTLDVYTVQANATFLTGLLASTEPVLPMAFNVVYPPTASFLGAQTVQNPLYLFINPNTWQRTSNKALFKSYIRNGIKTERWGEELEQISASGTIAACYTQETGLTRYYRGQTPSFRNLMELVQIYRNNGCIYANSYDGNTGAPSTSRRIVDVGYVEILYGFELFRGTFDSFTIVEDASKPFTLAYSFIFNCEKVISIHDMINQSTDTQTMASNLTIPAGQFSQQQVAQIQQQQLNSTNLASQYNITNKTNALNPANVNANPGDPGLLNLNQSNSGT